MLWVNTYTHDWLIIINVIKYFDSENSVVILIFALPEYSKQGTISNQWSR